MKSTKFFQIRRPEKIKNNNTQESASGMSEAIRYTIQTVNVRVMRFKIFTIIFVLVILIFVVWAGIQMSWYPLLGLLLPVLLCGIFLYSDACLVDRWQRRILETWIQEGLNLDIFHKAINTIPVRPLRTLHSMIKSLPSKKECNCIDELTPVTRNAISMTLKTINSCQKDWTAFATLACTSGLLFLSIAIIQWYWLSLLGSLFIFPLIGIGKWVSLFRLKHWRQQILEMSQQKGLEISNFAKIAIQLDWGAILDKKKHVLLNFLTKDS